MLFSRSSHTSSLFATLLFITFIVMLSGFSSIPVASAFDTKTVLETHVLSEEEEEKEEAEQYKFPTGEVHVLTDDNFEELTDEGNWLIEFYAPWCGHCQKLQPIFEETAQVLTDTYLGKVDCDSYKTLCSNYDVRGYPTIKFKMGDAVVPYKGARTVEAFKAFVERASGPVLREVAFTDMQGFRPTDENEVAYLLLGGTPIVHEELKNVAAPMMFEHRFGVVDTKNVSVKHMTRALREMGVPDADEAAVNAVKEDGVLLALRADDVSVMLKELDEDEVLDEWVHNHRLPAVVEVNDRTYETLSAETRPLYVVVISTAQDADAASRARRELHVVADVDRSRVFAFLDHARYSGFVENTLGVAASDLPALLRVDFKNNQLMRAPAPARRHDGALVDADMLKDFTSKAEDDSLSFEAFGGSFFGGLWTAVKNVIRYLTDNPKVATAVVLAYIGVLAGIVYLVKRNYGPEITSDDVDKDEAADAATGVPDAATAALRKKDDGDAPPSPKPTESGNSDDSSKANKKKKSGSASSKQD